jgi:hypothetical protein
VQGRDWFESVHAVEAFMSSRNLVGYLVRYCSGCSDGGSGGGGGGGESGGGSAGGSGGSGSAALLGVVTAGRSDGGFAVQFQDGDTRY